jgi:hypothetical protein
MSGCTPQYIRPRFEKFGILPNVTDLKLYCLGEIGLGRRCWHSRLVLQIVKNKSYYSTRLLGRLKNDLVNKVS